MYALLSQPGMYWACDFGTIDTKQHLRKISLFIGSQGINQGWLLSFQTRIIFDKCFLPLTPAFSPSLTLSGVRKLKLK